MQEKVKKISWNTDQKDQKTGNTREKCQER